MASKRLIAAVRALAGTGDYGGWRRDLEMSGPLMTVWHDRDDRLVIVLEPGRPGDRWATIRIFQRMDIGLVNLADCKVGSWVAALRILHAYRILPGSVACDGLYRETR